MLHDHHRPAHCRCPAMFTRVSVPVTVKEPSAARQDGGGTT
jgi:hypothetical protein